ncbi:MAG: hypothetical protein HYV20_01970 [Gemmatimonadetes bacterium]|nr:hypothetical protein [Gemmatimonadota bacterium]
MKDRRSWATTGRDQRRPHIATGLTAFLLTLAGCSPGPRWIAVAGDHRLTFFDGDLRSTGAWRLDITPTAIESTGDGFGVLIGSGAGAQAGGVTWLRRTDGETILQHQLNAPVRGLWSDREGRRVFALGGGAVGTLRILRADRLTQSRAIPVCAEPVSLVFAPDGDRAYVTCRPGVVVEVDANLQIVVRSAWVGPDSGRSCGAGRGDLSANGTLLFVPCATSGRLIYMDRATLKPWDSMPVGVGAKVMAVTPGAVAVTLFPDSDRVALVNLRSKRLIAVVSIPNPVDVALSADGRLAFVLAAERTGAEGALLQMDTRTGAELGRVVLRGGGRAVYVWPGRREPRMYWVSGSRRGR